MSLSHELTIHPVDFDASHLGSGRDEIDIVNSALVAPHVDAGRGAVKARALLRPNVEGRKRKVLPVSRKMKFFVT